MVAAEDFGAGHHRHAVEEGDVGTERVGEDPVQVCGLDRFVVEGRAPGLGAGVALDFQGVEELPNVLH